ncbi:MAG: replication initiation factor [Circular genetic element sp.]|nr:MAG: replication initiation factor [Circular genetic element sp.]
MHSAAKLEFLSSGIDWITVTSTDRKNNISMATKAAQLVRYEIQNGNIRKPWGMSGFTGWKAGSIQFGKRDDELIVRLGSNLAHDNWRFFYALANNCSRIDLECTTRTDADAHRRVRRHWKEATRYQQQRARQAFVGHYSGNDKSETLYLGRRVSDIFGRIYDKGRESKLDHYQNAVRYEIELKGARARDTAAQLYAEPSEIPAVCSRVAGFLKKRGVVLPRCWASEYHLGRPRPACDRDRMLAWMQKAIRPSAIALASSGSLDLLLDALGLSGLVQPVPQPCAHTSKGRKEYVC